jgi:hypothetical protein
VVGHPRRAVPVATLTGVAAFGEGSVLTTDVVEGRGRRRRVRPLAVSGAGLSWGEPAVSIPWRDIIDTYVERGRLCVSYGADRRFPHHLRLPVGELTAHLFAEEIVRRRRDAAFEAATTRTVPAQRDPR